MKNVYFVHRDKNAIERQSDGVEFCIIPELYDGKIYFYCHEYDIFWRSIKDAGDYTKCCDFHLNGLIHPATLIEISNADLISYIGSIKEYKIENNKLININYIHLNNDFLNLHQNA
ncbi:hypothetical protein JYG55_20055 [Escherichia fergusonii]|uniref:hypothetical protein n=1 Tax=Escherichia fergusonii TaxID=564 RepID=UPI001CBDE25E|nr:hypothetical protein [Escherichia fergusonii]MBZ4134893.1 hypothetical protein [Escherichia fergusonii]MBZ4174905.1 hypothetical protein [Escherichia fergusonii]UAW38121.1 hypothetical protein JW961_16315 [Escherichia fergusonii]